MPAARKFSDEDIKRHFEQTGNVKETARRLKVQYNAAYKRLVQLNMIRVSTFDAGRGETTERTIPEGTTLIVPDMQAPAQHPDTLPFLCAIRDRIKPIHTVCIGDELDMNWLSDFARLPEADQPHSEFAAAQAFLRSFYAEFTTGVSCVSNHVHGRFDRARTRGRIPSAFMRPIEDIIDAPVGWSWHSAIRMGDIIIRHGHKDVQNLKRVILEEMPARYGRPYSILIGHYHTKIGQHTPDIQVGDRFYWGGFTGCLIDPQHPFFGYSRGYERLGTVAIIDGRLRPFSMPVDSRGRWTGEIV